MNEASSPSFLSFRPCAFSPRMRPSLSPVNIERVVSLKASRKSSVIFLVRPKSSRPRRLPGRAEEIAGMRIGVEVAVAHDLLHVDLDEEREEDLRIEPAARRPSRFVILMPSM